MADSRCLAAGAGPLLISDVRHGWQGCCIWHASEGIQPGALENRRDVSPGSTLPHPPPSVAPRPKIPYVHRIQEQFVAALKETVAVKPLPMNLSFLADTLRKRNPDWDVKRDTGDTFATLCEVRHVEEGVGRGDVTSP